MSETLFRGHVTQTRLNLGFQNHGYIDYGDSDNDDEHHVYEEISPYSTTEDRKQSTIGVQFTKCIASGSGADRRKRKSMLTSRSSESTVGCGTALFDLLQFSARRVAEASSSSGVSEDTGSHSDIKCSEVDRCAGRVEDRESTNEEKLSTDPEVDEPVHCRHGRHHHGRTAINDLYYGQRVINYYDNQDDVIERPAFWSHVPPTLETRYSDDGDVHSRPPPEVPTYNDQNFIVQQVDRRRREEHRRGCNNRCYCRKHKCSSEICKNIDPLTITTPTYVNYEVDLDAVAPRSSRREFTSLFTSSPIQKCNRRHLSCQSFTTANTANNGADRSSTGPSVTTETNCDDDRCCRKQSVADADAEASSFNFRPRNYVNWPPSPSKIIPRIRRVGAVKNGQPASVPKVTESGSRTQPTNARKLHFEANIQTPFIDDPEHPSDVCGQQRRCSGRCELIPPAYVTPDVIARIRTNGSEDRRSRSTRATDCQTPANVDRRRHNRYHVIDNNNNDDFSDNDQLIRFGHRSQQRRVRSDSRVKVPRCHCHHQDDLRSHVRHSRSKQRANDSRVHRRVVQTDACTPCGRQLPANFSTDSDCRLHHHVENSRLASRVESDDDDDNDNDDDVFLRHRRDLSSSLTMEFVRTLRRSAASTAIVTGLAVQVSRSNNGEKMRDRRHGRRRMEPLIGSSPLIERGPPGWRRCRKRSRSEVLVVVDMKSAQVLDVVTGEILRTIGQTDSSSSEFGAVHSGRKSWLREPMATCVISDHRNYSDRLAFIDRADQTVKVCTAHGRLLRTVELIDASNIIGLAVSEHSVSSRRQRSTFQMHVSDTGNGSVYTYNLNSDDCSSTTSSVYESGSKRIRIGSTTSSTASSTSSTNLIPAAAAINVCAPTITRPYCIAHNPKTGHLLIGDVGQGAVVAIDDANVVGLRRHQRPGARVCWKFAPAQCCRHMKQAETHDTAVLGRKSCRYHTLRRPFFPSSIAVDRHDGKVFVTDLYNYAIYVVDADGNHVGTLDLLLDKFTGETSAMCDPDRELLMTHERASSGNTNGGPTALAIDPDKQLLYVAIDGRVINIYRYSDDTVENLPSTSASATCVPESTSWVVGHRGTSALGLHQRL